MVPVKYEGTNHGRESIPITLSLIPSIALFFLGVLRKNSIERNIWLSRAALALGILLIIAHAKSTDSSGIGLLLDCSLAGYLLGTGLRDVAGVRDPSTRRRVVKFAWGTLFALILVNIVLSASSFFVRRAKLADVVCRMKQVVPLAVPKTNETYIHNTSSSYPKRNTSWKA